MMGLLRSFGAPQVCGISTGRRPLVPRRSAGGRSSFHSVSARIANAPVVLLASLGQAGAGQPLLSWGLAVSNSVPASSHNVARAAGGRSNEDRPPFS